MASNAKKLERWVSCKKDKLVEMKILRLLPAFHGSFSFSDVVFVFPLENTRFWSQPKPITRVLREPPLSIVY